MNLKKSSVMHFVLKEINSSEWLPITLLEGYSPEARGSKPFTPTRELPMDPTEVFKQAYNSRPLAENAMS